MVLVYKVGGAVMLLIPTFGLIHEILAFDVDTYYLVCEELHTLCFQAHFHSFEVTHKECMTYFICELIDHNVLKYFLVY